MTRKAASYVLCIALSILTTPRAFAEIQQFDSSSLHGLRLDWCARFGADCGKPAADLFCRVNGFAENGG